MPELDADFIISNNNQLETEYELGEGQHFDCSFEIFAAGTTWGSIDGNIENQTDLIEVLSEKADNSTVEDLAQTVLDDYTELDGKISDNHTEITSHIADKTNPHEVTKTQVGLGNVDNTSDLNKPISIATQTALNGKQNTISDLSTIRSNASNGQSAYNTIQTFGDIVTYDASSFATSIQGGLADSALQPNDDITKLNNNAGYITSASLPTVNNATIKFQKNGTDVKTITLNQSSNETVNFPIPTTASDVGAVPTSRTVNSKSLANNISLNSSDVGALASTTTINDLTTTTQQNALNSGATSTNISQITTNKNNISDIQDLIPIQATDTNQLADKSFVNSSIATNTANFIGTFQSVAALEAYSGTLTNNDYAFVETTDSAGNTLFDRYKYTTATTPASWQFEYELNNSSFTSNQWAAINSGATGTNIGQIATNTNDIQTINTTIGGYGNIVTHNTSEFATSTQGDKADTALQPNDNITELTNNAGFITGITSPDVTTALGYIPYNSSNPNGYTSNTGTVTSVNNAQPDSNGNVSLTMPTVDQTYDPTSANAQSGAAIAGAGFLKYNGVLSAATDLTTLKAGTYSIGGINHSDFPVNFAAYGALIQYEGAYKIQELIVGPGVSSNQGVTHIYHRRWLTSSSTFTSWVREISTQADIISALGYTPYNSSNPDGYTTNVGTVTSVNNTFPDSNGNVSLTIPTYSAFTGADSITGGTSGLVPAPVAGDNEKYLCGDGTFKTISGGTTEIFIAEYGTTTYQQVLDAYNAGKTIIAVENASSTQQYIYSLAYCWTSGNGGFSFESIIEYHTNKRIVLNGSTGWDAGTSFYLVGIGSSQPTTVGDANTPVYISMQTPRACTFRRITETYSSGQSWYNLYSDKWCEQGGYISSTATGYPDKATTYFLKEFTNTNYTIIAGVKSTYQSSAAPVYLGVNNIYTDRFTTSPSGTNCPKYWVAFGYVN